MVLYQDVYAKSLALGVDGLEGVHCIYPWKRLQLSFVIFFAAMCKCIQLHFSFEPHSSILMHTQLCIILLPA